MGHQDTKLTFMRPRLKELNDIPYIKKGMSLALARMQYDRFIVIYLCNLRPKPSDVHQKPSDAHQKSSDAHPKASDEKRRDNR